MLTVVPYDRLLKADHIFPPLYPPVVRVAYISVPYFFPPSAFGTQSEGGWSVTIFAACCLSACMNLQVLIYLTTFLLLILDILSSVSALLTQILVIFLSTGRQMQQKSAAYFFLLLCQAYVLTQKMDAARSSKRSMKCYRLLRVIYQKIVPIASHFI